MDRLAIFIAVIGGSSIAGALVIAAFSLGYYGYWVIAACVIAGLVMAWPTGYLVARRIKREDPAWNERRNEPKPGLKR
ncbi:hypothetical protein D6850_00515 [Roseovarius spongiae]|uniref:CTP synthetase n=1 Tax=Roseovarius spongiae TaxID=2320272 RepID=A0A3A8B3Q0_9RHOB|nr:hypothetical protein [Roseovarius spongiae]RKF16091.1 hypothetical protein D6850_00515 [Roseovarius spongiae]